MSDYLIRLQTDKNLGSERFVRDFLQGWFGELDEKLRPELFDFGEPVRRSLKSESIETAIDAWVSSGMSLYFRRKSRPKFLVATEWFRREKGKDLRLFPWSVTVWLDSRAGDKSSLELMRFLVKHFEPGFGLLTNETDYTSKHFFSFEDFDGTTEKYLGQDIAEKDQRLPGVYWVTYFGSWSVAKIGKSRFANLTDHCEQIAAGRLITAYSSSAEIGSVAGLAKERELVNKLGHHNFFDRAEVNLDSLRTSADTVRVIEDKIKQLKEE